MELSYHCKKSEQTVLSAAKRFSPKESIATDKCLLFRGDCFEAMAMLLPEYKGKIQLVYLDPPVNGYMSEGCKAARVSADEYVEFVRERLILARELLSEDGSVYIHTPSKDAFAVKLIADEVFGENAYRNDIARVRTNPRNSAQNAYGCEKDTLLFYTKNPDGYVWNDVRIAISEEEYSEKFNKTDQYGRRYATVALHAPGKTKSGATGEKWRGLSAPEGRHWMTTPEELDRLDAEGRIEWSASGNPRLIVYAYEYEGKRLQDVWEYKDPQNPSRPGEKNTELCELIVRQSSKKDGLVLDMFSGSGAFLRAAETHNRRWIGVECDAEAVDSIMAKAKRSFEFFDLFTGHRQSVTKLQAHQLSFFDEI